MAVHVVLSLQQLNILCLFVGYKASKEEYDLDISFTGNSLGLFCANQVIHLHTYTFLYFVY